MRFVTPFVDVVLIVLDLLQWTVFIWVIISWILFFASQSSMRWRYRGFYNVLSQLNEIFTRLTYPFLRPFRRLLRRVDTAGIDWSPLLLLLVIYLIRRLLIAAILTV
jgi:uncharacterized protein YggT (Ycf19 family)